MIYISLTHCQKDRKSQHRAAISLFYDMLQRLNLPHTDIQKEESGRPYVDLNDLDVSISHSGNCAAVAVITERKANNDGILAFPFSGSRIGLDIEEEKENADIDNFKKIARRFLDTEISSVEEFYRLWTLNESYGKMTGEGVICKKEPPCHQHTLCIPFNEKKLWISYSAK